MTKITAIIQEIPHISKKYYIQNTLSCVCIFLTFWLNYKFKKKSCLSCRVMQTDEKMSNKRSTLAELLHMIIPMIKWHWDTPYTWGRLPQLQDWWLNLMVLYVIKIWEITSQITSKIHVCVVSFLQEVQIYKKTYIFHIKSEKLIKRINMCNTHDDVYRCTIVLCIWQLYIVYPKYKSWVFVSVTHKVHIKIWFCSIV